MLVSCKQLDFGCLPAISVLCWRGHQLLRSNFRAIALTSIEAVLERIAIALDQLPRESCFQEVA